MRTLSNLQKLKTPQRLGMTHFGVIVGKKNVRYFMEEHETFLKDFRSKVIQYYDEKPETKYVVDKLAPYFVDRTDMPGAGKENFALNDTLLAVIYGMMLDLGYRELDDMDKKMLEKYRDKYGKN
jgi:hypothetical protein